MRNASHTTGWEPPPTRSTHRRNGYTSRPVEAECSVSLAQGGQSARI